MIARINVCVSWLSLSVSLYLSSDGNSWELSGFTMDIMYAIRISWEYTPIEFDFLLPANETCIFSAGSSQPCLTTGYIQLVYVERERESALFCRSVSFYRKRSRNGVSACCKLSAKIERCSPPSNTEPAHPVDNTIFQKSPHRSILRCVIPIMVYNNFLVAEIFRDSLMFIVFDLIPR